MSLFTVGRLRALVNHLDVDYGENGDYDALSKSEISELLLARIELHNMGRLALDVDDAAQRLQADLDTGDWLLDEQ